MAANKVQQLQKEILQLTETIIKNGKATKQQVKELKNLENQYNKLVSKAMPQYRKGQQDVNKALSNSKKFTDEATKSSSNYFTRLKTAVGTLSRYYLAFQAINLVTKAFTELTIGSIKEAIKFEKALGNLSAVAGVSGSELKTLSENALEVAGQTKFTAEEIVGLQTELSKLGFSAEDVVKSTQSIAFAAQALGSPLESTAALVGKVRNQFGLLVEQTTEIADTLVSSINESALSFESFGTAIQYVGPIANQLGLSLQQTVGAMAALADSGFTASRIGTGLRGILTELGKTSADAQKSLEALAEQNISLGEAVELVGKRNAAQLITLLKNIDVIDETNNKYYQQGRALFAAAEQANTFNGQMEILNSEFQKFRINIGNSIVESDLFISVLGILSREAQRTAYGFRTLSEIGFDAYNEDVEKAVGGTDEFRVALSRLYKNNEITEKQYRDLARNLSAMTRNGADFNDIVDYLGNVAPLAYGEARDKLAAYLDLLKQGVDTQKEQNAVTKGAEIANKSYGEAVEELIDKSLKGIVVDKEADELSKRITRTLDLYSNSLNRNTKLSKETQTQYKSTIATLQRYLDQLTNVYASEEQLLELRTKEQEKGLKVELAAIKRRTKEQVDAINERAKMETAIAETAEERADIEAERAVLVSEAYKEQSAAIRGLSKEFDTQLEKIENAAYASDQLAEVLGSDVVNDLNKAFNEYSSELSSLSKALDSGVISQEDYERSVGELRNRLKTTISTFKEMFGTSPELDKFFENLLINFDSLSFLTDKTKKNLEDFKEEFKDDLWSDYAQKSVEALTESLSEFNDTSFENLKNSEEAKLDVVKRRYKLEEEILKSQLNNQLITESQFRTKQRELQKAQLAEENSINRKIFDAEKRQDRNDAFLEGAEAIAQSYIEAFKNYEPVTAAIVGSIGAGIAAVQTAAQVTAINQRKFFPKKFAEGGMVSGPSHAEGGVPFTVQGNGGYEMEGGEFVVNKRATAMHKDLLERINNSYKTNPMTGTRKFAQGGLVGIQANESVDYLKAIAEATTSTAISTSKPVRAYVSSKDLRQNETERRLRDRNDRI